MNLLTLLLQTTDTLVTPPVLTPTVETAGDLNLWELACKGGIIMIPLLLLSLLSIYIFFERLQVIRRAAREDNTFMERIKDYIHEGDIDSALKLCKKNQYALFPTYRQRYLSLGSSHERCFSSHRKRGKHRNRQTRKKDFRG